MPSIVVISFPSCITARLRHESTLLPFTCTVQAPHWPESQPFFVPVRANCSRRRSRRVTRGSMLRLCSFPFILIDSLTVSKKAETFSSHSETAAFNNVGGVMAKAVKSDDCFRKSRLVSSGHLESSVKKLQFSLL